jgi:hypothetical protein
MRILSILLICPFLTGCLACGYPSITQTPPIAVKDLEVKAFRVTTGITRYGGAIAGAIKFDGEIEEIAALNGVVPAQDDSHWRYYYLAFPYEGYYSRTLEIRLYRRGFETEVIDARPAIEGLWAAPVVEPHLKRAESVEAQEKAIDDVVAGVWRLDSQRISFLADEYLTIARSPQLIGPEHEDTRKRLEQKARNLGSKGSCE